MLAQLNSFKKAAILDFFKQSIKPDDNEQIIEINNSDNTLLLMYSNFQKYFILMNLNESDTSFSRVNISFDNMISYLKDHPEIISNEELLKILLDS